MLLLRSAQQTRLSTSRLVTSPRLLNSWRPLFRIHTPFTTRLATTSTPPTLPTQPTPKKPIFPARLLIYHAGTGRTVFIGCLKVTTIFLFAFFGLIAAPAQLAAPTLPYWRFTTTLLTGLLPLLFVSLTTAPFVTYIHLRLPLYARHSHDLLSRYLASLPKTGEIDITTITLIGRPRIQKLTLGDLEAVKQRPLNVANFRRVGRDATRPWWAGKGQVSYAVGNEGARGVKMRWVWDVVAEAIRKGNLREAPTGRVKSVGAVGLEKGKLSKTTTATSRK